MGSSREAHRELRWELVAVALNTEYGSKVRIQIEEERHALFLNTEYGSKVRIQIEEDWHVMIQITGHMSELHKIIEEDCIIMRWRPHMMLQMAHTGLVSLAEYGTKSVVMGVVTFIFQVQQAQPKRNAVQMVFCHL